MNVRDKVVWLTGASSGIGEALAYELAGQGAILVLSARSEAKLEALKASLANADMHLVLPLDLSEPEHFSAALDTVIQQKGRLDILINNGGISQRGLVRDIDVSVHREVMEINYFGTIALTKTALPPLLEAGGMVVNIASVAGKVGGQSMSGYAASKHALIGFMDCLRAEEAGNGLKVLNVCPGFVKTNISRNARTADGSQFGEMADSIASGISPQSCAQSIVQAMKSDKREVVIGTGLSGWAPTLKRFFPGLLMTMAARKNIR